MNKNTSKGLSRLDTGGRKFISLSRTKIYLFRKAPREKEANSKIYGDCLKKEKSNRIDIK